MAPRYNSARGGKDATVDVVLVEALRTGSPDGPRAPSVGWRPAPALAEAPAMTSRSIKTLQQILAADGRYTGPVTGTRDSLTEAAVDAMIAARAGDLVQNPAGWSARWRAVACLQLACRDRGIAAGPVDGLWGTETQTWYDDLLELLATGVRPPPWRDRAETSANPNGWPTQAEADLRGFFGPPTDAGLVAVACPWRLTIAWDQRASTSTIRCHPKVAGSLERVLSRVGDHYGEERLRELGLHLYGGCYNHRPMRGGTALSTHAWGIAIDWDPARNQLKWGRDRAALAAPAYEAWWRAWEEEGWVSLGRARNFDWMHVQAARL